VFVREGSHWIEQQKLTASDAMEADLFGVSVALSASGKTALIGTHLADCTAGEDCGAAYVFVREGSHWVEQQKLTASDTVVFGRSVALSASGKTALIGASAADCHAGEDCGAAYVFVQKKQGGWVERQKLTASDTVEFGLFVALSASGKTALIGAVGDDCTTGGFCDAAYVFVREGSHWVERQKLTASDAVPGAGNNFGRSIALSASGKTALIGTSVVDCTTGGFCGAAYVFVREGSHWVERQKLTASDGAQDDLFGDSVTLSASGKTALIGAPRVDCAAGESCGAAYTFRR
jgi:FG-GAP repeat